MKIISQLTNAEKKILDIPQDRERPFAIFEIEDIKIANILVKKGILLSKGEIYYQINPDYIHENHT